MKKLLLSLALVVVAGAATIAGTGAFFSATETSTGNTFSAGASDLLIDNPSYYNGAANASTTWVPPADLDTLFDPDGDGPIGLIPRLFFSFDDLKPGDTGEDTISIHVDNNPAYACMMIDITATDDPTITEPEGEDGDTTQGAGNGELQDEVNF